MFENACIYALYFEGVYDCCYIGSSVNIDNMFRAHRGNLRRGKHSSPHLQHAFNKYSEQLFKYRILSEPVVSSKKELRLVEQQYIDSFIANNGRDKLYNATTTALCPTDDPEIETKRLKSCEEFRKNNPDKFGKAFKEQGSNKEFQKVRLAALSKVFELQREERTERFRTLRNSTEFKMKRLESLRDSVCEPIVFIYNGQKFRYREEAKKTFGFKSNGLTGYMNRNYKISLLVKESDYDEMTEQEIEERLNKSLRKSSIMWKWFNDRCLLDLDDRIIRNV